MYLLFLFYLLARHSAAKTGDKLPINSVFSVPGEIENTIAFVNFFAMKNQAI